MYSKSYILQIAILDYFLTSIFTNATFWFPQYMKQSKEIMHAYIQQRIYVFHFMFYINHLMFEILL